MAAHYKVGLLGVYLLASCVVIAVIGLQGVASSQKQHAQLARREAPALAFLLQIDRDLYQAQLGLERAGSSTSLATRRRNIEFFDQNVRESGERFAAYQSLAASGDLEVSRINAYSINRASWLLSADEFIHAIDLGSDAAPAVSPSLQRVTKDVDQNFETMRQDVNRIVDDVYQPAISASGDRADRHAWLTYFTLLSGGGATILAGVVLTAKIFRISRVQQRASESLNGKSNPRRLLTRSRGCSIDAASRKRCISWAGRKRRLPSHTATLTTSRI